MLSTGEIIDGKYRIIRMVGEGGMGAVYEGENTRIHRRVAIKVLHAGLASQADTVARFEREAQAAGRIGSEHIVEVLDLGVLLNGDRYLVMEFLDGESLSKRIQQHGRLTPEQVVPIARQLLEALIAAHGAGIVHRDLKPDNVYLLKKNASQVDFVKLLDFGISKFNQLSGDSGFSMTRTGAVMGTPYYMAPEQAKGSREIDHRVDLYALGVILYECVTGQLPFKADTFNQLLFKIALEVPRPIEEMIPDIDQGFVSIVKRAMAREPAHRFQSASEMQQALAAWAPGAPTEFRFAQSPAPDYASPVPVVAEARTASVQPQLGNRTGGSWANTNGDAPKKHPTGVLLAIALSGLLLLGGGAFAVYKLFSPHPDAAVVATTASSPTPETHAASAETAAAVAAPVSEPSAAAFVEPVPSASIAKPNPPPRVVAQRPPAEAKTSKTQNTPAQPPLSKSAPTATPTGRKFRTAL